MKTKASKKSSGQTHKLDQLIIQGVSLCSMNTTIPIELQFLNTDFFDIIEIGLQIKGSKLSTFLFSKRYRLTASDRISLLITIKPLSGQGHYLEFIIYLSCFSFSEASLENLLTYHTVPRIFREYVEVSHSAEVSHCANSLYHKSPIRVSAPLTRFHSKLKSIKLFFTSKLQSSYNHL